MTTPELISEMVLRVIADQLQIPVETVTVEKRLAEDLGADSMDMAEIAMSIESHLTGHAPVDIHALAACDTVQSLIDLAEHFNLPF